MSSKRHVRLPSLLGRRFFAAWMWCLPGHFRRRFGDEMLVAYEADARLARARGRLSAVHFATRATVGLLVTILAVHWQVLTDHRATGRRRRTTGISLMEALLLDARTALRNLARRPTYALLAILTLALGIGANTIIFSMVNGVLLEPLPFADQDRLVTLVYPGSREADIARPDGQDLRERSQSLEHVALFIPFWALDLAGDGEPVRIAASVVEPSYFALFDAPPLLGRLLQPSDDQLGAEKVVVLSERLWRERFAAREQVLGEVLRFSDEPYTVVGVAPSSLDVLELGTDVWVAPLPTVPWVDGNRGTNNFEVLAKLRPGVELEAAGRETQAIFAELEQAHPATNRNKTAVPVPVRDFLTADLSATLWLLSAAVGLVLLIVCANLATLVLLRSSDRARELATRRALGGSSRALLRLLVVETAVIGAAGGALGVAFAYTALEPLLRLIPVGLPRLESIEVDGAVLLVTVALSVLVTLAAGLLPALLILRSVPGSRLVTRTSGLSAGRGRSVFQSGLIAAEVALAFLLLVGSILLLRSLQELRGVELGFDPEGVLAANVVLPESRYGEIEQQNSAIGQILEELEAIPSVSSAAFVIGAPLANFGDIGSSVVLGDRPLPEPGERLGARIRPTLGDLRGTLGLRLLEGRDFESRGADGPLEVIVNRSFAEAHFPDSTPVGEQFSMISGGGEPLWREIVGVVEDVKTGSLSDGDADAVYLPYEQRNQNWQRFGTLLLRTELPADQLAQPMREAVWAVDPNLPLEGLQPMPWAVHQATARERFVSTATAGFTLFALWMAIQGIYGVVAFTVRRRRSEIGVRLALGAERQAVLRGTIVRALRPVAVGIVVGLLGAFALVRLMSQLLFEVSSSDPATYLMAVVALVLAGAAASALPAHRASRIDPASTLREE